MTITRGYRQLIDEAIAQHGDPDAVFVDIRDVSEPERAGVPIAARLTKA